MKIQCADGILNIEENTSKQTMAAARIAWVELSLADAKARKPHYRTPATMAEVETVLSAKNAAEQRKTNAETQKRTDWLTRLSDADLIERERQALGADMMLPADMRTEMVKRGLTAKISVDTTSDFAKYVVAKNKAEREGRSDDFEDGIN